MIISHRHRFIFIKTRKTAGTSIEKALAAICGPEDVLTPDHLHAGEADALAGTARSYRGAFNPLPEILGAASPLDAARAARDFLTRPKFYNHIRASAVRARVPREVWEGYRKFCFERNPWDKVISFYFWVHRHGEPMRPLDEYILAEDDGLSLDQKFPSDWDRYADRDRIIVDEVLDFSDLAGGLDGALERAGVPASVRAGLELPRLKTGIRKQARLEIGPEASARIERVFSREIARFGYVNPFAAV